VWVEDGDRVLVGIVGIGSPGGEGREGGGRRRGSGDEEG
jgi:hypothetical protein